MRFSSRMRVRSLSAWNNCSSVSGVVFIVPSITFVTTDVTIRTRPKISCSSGLIARCTRPSIVFLRGKARSEEHTSELQSRLHLVCRLLLEKKKHDTDVEVLAARDLNRY